jgi:hypothetical protein
MAIGGPSFSSVRRARELLREKSEEILRFYMDLAKLAAANGDFETAEKIGWKLLDHATDEDGTTIVAPSVDIKAKQLESSKQSGPTILIGGINIGGLNKALPEPVIEIVDTKRIDDDN